MRRKIFGVVLICIPFLVPLVCLYAEYGIEAVVYVATRAAVCGIGATIAGWGFYLVLEQK